MEPSKSTTEELILEAAQAVFLEKGLAGARMQEIADRAGINKALLHYYFRSKEKLSELIINRAVGALLPRMVAALETEADLFEKIRRLAGEYITFVSQNSFLPLFIVNEVNRNPQFFFKMAVQHQKPHLDKFRQQVEEAVAKGRIRPISSAQLLMNLMSLVLFPFLGKPIFAVALGLSEEEYRQEMERRRTEVAEFIIRAIAV
ncbi:MAG: TetR/AcrR family transcriptional regulator [Bacteroidota bacterium]|nr:TetR/AcrR family transcriptional regulator [Bacteroidota bacterium]